MKIRKIITKAYYRKTPDHDWLKYFRVVRFWVREAYGLNYPELEMLLFLYGENLFTRKDFDNFEKLMSWDKARFGNLLKDDWVVIWRKRGNKYESHLYTVSYKGKRLINSIYKKLSGEEIITENPSKNPLFRKKIPAQNVMYRNMIVEMNKSIRQRQHLSQE